VSRVFNGRYAAKAEESYVVFLIGMRVKQWWRGRQDAGRPTQVQTCINTGQRHEQKQHKHCNG